MKYFLGSTLVNDNGVSHEAYALFVAATQAGAMLLLEARSSMFAGDDGVESGNGSWSFREGRVTTKVGILKEISPVGYASLSEVHPVFKSSDKGLINYGELSENVKTLAHRIGGQLKKLSVDVPHSKLLNAVAASMGETDWAVVLNKKAPASDVASKPTSLPAEVRVTATQMGAGPWAKYWRIEGYVGTTLVLAISNHLRGQWHVGSCLAWMGSLDEAEVYGACANEVIRVAKEKAAIVYSD